MQLAIDFEEYKKQYQYLIDILQLDLAYCNEKGRAIERLKESLFWAKEAVNITNKAEW